MDSEEREVIHNRYHSSDLVDIWEQCDPDPAHWETQPPVDLFAHKILDAIRTEIQEWDDGEAVWPEICATLALGDWPLHDPPPPPPPETCPVCGLEPECPATWVRINTNLKVCTRDRCVQTGQDVETAATSLAKKGLTHLFDKYRYGDDGNTPT